MSTPGGSSATRAVLAAALVASLVGGCGSGPRGLGRKACGYVRPRLVRVDRDRLPGATAPTGDLNAVSQDMDVYVSQLPAGGRARSDRQLVAFAAALHTVASQATPDNRGVSRLETTEGSLKHRCGVPTG